MEIQVIRADSEELLARSRNVRRQVFTLEKGIAEEIETDAEDCLTGGCEHFLVLCEGKDAGAFRCMPTAEGVVRLQRFCILKTVRGTGAGRKTLKEMEVWYRRRGYGRIELDAKFQVEGFYRACGYQTVSEPFMEAGVLHVRMVREI